MNSIFIAFAAIVVLAWIVELTRNWNEKRGARNEIGTSGGSTLRLALFRIPSIRTANCASEP